MPDLPPPAAPPLAAAATARQALQAAPWLAGVPPETLDRLSDKGLLHGLPAGSQIFAQAETPAFAQFLVRGRVALLAVRGTDETLVELVPPVDLLLPAAVLNRQPYLLSARVIEEAQLVLIHADAFRRAVASDHAFCLAVLACQAAHFRRQVKQAKNVRLRSAEERAGCYVVALAATAAAGQAVRLRFEKRLIATQLGMTRETFSRALAGLARHGIRVRGDTIRFDDVTLARALFALDPLIDGAETAVPLAVVANG
jgi:CRP/FNR family transcriptional activator FtrB